MHWIIKYSTIFIPLYLTVATVGLLVAPHVDFWLNSLYLPHAAIAAQLPVAMSAGASWTVDFTESLGETASLLVIVFLGIVASWSAGGMNLDEHKETLCTDFWWNKFSLQDTFQSPHVTVRYNDNSTCRLLLRVNNTLFWANGIVLTLYSMLILWMCGFGSRRRPRWCIGGL